MKWNIIYFILNMGLCVSTKKVINCGPSEKAENGKCVPCPNCPAGQGLVKDCGFGYGSGLHCVPCKRGITFRNTFNYLKCQRCTNCTLYNRVFKYYCRENVDAECGECFSGYFDWSKDTTAVLSTTICEHCSLKPSNPQCHGYQALLSPEIELPPKTELSKTEDVEEVPNSHGRYRLSTWILLAALMMAIGVIVYQCRNKQNRLSCFGKGGFFCKKGISDDNEPKLQKAKERKANLIKLSTIHNDEPVSLLVNSLNDDPEITNAENENEVNDINENYLHAASIVGVTHVRGAAPKVGRSVSDPGPNTTNIPCTEEGVDLEVPTCPQKTSDDVVIQIPPAEVHTPCDTDIPNMAVPFDSSTDVNWNHIIENHEVLSDELGSVQADSFVSQGSTLQIRNIENDENISIPDDHVSEDVIAPESHGRASVDLSQASTLLIRNQGEMIQNETESSENNLDYNMGAPSNEDNYGDFFLHTNINTGNNSPENMLRSATVPNPTTIQITINNHVTTTKQVAPEPGQEVDGDDDISLCHENDCVGTPDIDELTIPKCIDIMANRVSGSCAVSHACMSKIFHEPVQETVK